MNEIDMLFNSEFIGFVSSFIDTYLFLSTVAFYILITFRMSLQGVTLIMEMGRSEVQPVMNGWVWGYSAIWMMNKCKTICDSLFVGLTIYSCLKSFLVSTCCKIMPLLHTFMPYV